jgi:SNF2 family DNA or RNA helicase
VYQIDQAIDANHYASLEAQRLATDPGAQALDPVQQEQQLRDISLAMDLAADAQLVHQIGKRVGPCAGRLLPNEIALAESAERDAAKSAMDHFQKQCRENKVSGSQRADAMKASMVLSLLDAYDSKPGSLAPQVRAYLAPSLPTEAADQVAQSADFDAELKREGAGTRGERAWHSAPDRDVFGALSVPAPTAAVVVAGSAAVQLAGAGSGAGPSGASGSACAATVPAEVRAPAAPPDVVVLSDSDEDDVVQDAELGAGTSAVVSGEAVTPATKSSGKLVPLQPTATVPNAQQPKPRRSQLDTESDGAGSDGSNVRGAARGGFLVRSDADPRSDEQLSEDELGRCEAVLKQQRRCKKRKKGQTTKDADDATKPLSARARRARAHEGTAAAGAKHADGDAQTAAAEVAEDEDSGADHGDGSEPSDEDDEGSDEDDEDSDADDGDSSESEDGGDGKGKGSKTKGKGKARGTKKKKKKKKSKRTKHDADLDSDVRDLQRTERRRLKRQRSGQQNEQQMTVSLHGVRVNTSTAEQEPDVGFSSAEHLMLSSKLKTHQVAGIRFMWDNIIDTLAKLRHEAKTEATAQSIRATQINEGSAVLSMGARVADAAPNSGGAQGCILAHSMGLGKTLQVISLVKMLMHHPVMQRASAIAKPPKAAQVKVGSFPSVGDLKLVAATSIARGHRTRSVIASALMLVPVNTIANWRNEFDKWLPEGASGKCTRKTRWEKHRIAVDVVDNVKLKGFAVRAEHIAKWYAEAHRLLPGAQEVTAAQLDEESGGDADTCVVNGGTCGAVLIVGYTMFRRLTKDAEKALEAYDSARTEVIADQDNEGKTAKAKKALEVAIDAAKVLHCLVTPGPDLVFADEGHLLKNDASVTTKALQTIRSRRRVMLTGTPMQNHLIEYHCMVDLVRPRFLGSRKDFSSQYAIPIRNGQGVDATQKDKRKMLRQAHKLHNKLQGFVQRRGVEVLRRSLPPKVEHVIHIGQSRLQRRLSRMLRRRLNNSGGFECNVLAAFQSMLMINNHPRILQIAFDAGAGDDAPADDDDDANSAGAGAGAGTHMCKACGQQFTRQPAQAADASASSSAANSGKKSWICYNCTHRMASAPLVEIDGSDEEDADKASSAAAAAAVSAPASGSQDAVVDLCLSDDDGQQSATVPAPAPAPTPAAASAAGATAKRKRTKTAPQHAGKIGDKKAWWKCEYERVDNVEQREHSGKLEMLHAIMERVLERGEQALVFSQSLHTLSVIAMALESPSCAWAQGPAGAWKKGKQFDRIDGSMSSEVRQQKCDVFNNNADARRLAQEQAVAGSGSGSGSSAAKKNSEFDAGLQLLLISTKAGNLGINLVGATHVIVYDASWNPANDAQAVFRAYRFGQTKPVHIYRFVTAGTLESNIYKRQVAKMSMSHRVLDDRGVKSHYTTHEVTTLQLLHDGKGGDKSKGGGPADAAAGAAADDDVLPGSVLASALLAVRGAAGGTGAAAGDSHFEIECERHDSLTDESKESGLDDAERELMRMLDTGELQQLQDIYDWEVYLGR